MGRWERYWQNLAARQRQADDEDSYLFAQQSMTEEERKLDEARWAATWKRIGESQRRMAEQSAPLFAQQWADSDDD